ncbi:hypothetical protein F4677DRAFT_449154 [Hypoxylon crocopeplum]|nr:hypothetical protein F4677DRAFT_449154 [Hypoxylon crocopeplum]
MAELPMKLAEALLAALKCHNLDKDMLRAFFEEYAAGADKVALASNTLEAVISSLDSQNLLTNLHRHVLANLVGQLQGMPASANNGAANASSNAASGAAAHPQTNLPDSTPGVNHAVGDDASVPLHMSQDDGNQEDLAAAVSSHQNDLGSGQNIAAPPNGDAPLTEAQPSSFARRGRRSISPKTSEWDKADPFPRSPVEMTWGDKAKDWDVQPPECPEGSMAVAANSGDGTDLGYEPEHGVTDDYKYNAADGYNHDDGDDYEYGGEEDDSDSAQNDLDELEEIQNNWGAAGEQRVKREYESRIIWKPNTTHQDARLVVARQIQGNRREHARIFWYNDGVNPNPDPWGVLGDNPLAFPGGAQHSREDQNTGGQDTGDQNTGWDDNDHHQRDVEDDQQRAHHEKAQLASADQTSYRAAGTHEEANGEPKSKPDEPVKPATGSAAKQGDKPRRLLPHEYRYPIPREVLESGFSAEEKKALAAEKSVSKQPKKDYWW